MENQIDFVYFESRERYLLQREVFYKAIKTLRYFFCSKVYLIKGFVKVLNKFLHPNTTQNDDVLVSEKFFLFNVSVHYREKPSHQFYKSISRLILQLPDVEVMPIHGIFKVGNYFQRKSRTPLLLASMHL